MPTSPDDEQKHQAELPCANLAPIRSRSERAQRESRGHNWIFCEEHTRQLRGPTMSAEEWEARQREAEEGRRHSVNVRLPALQARTGLTEAEMWELLGIYDDMRSQSRGDQP